ncbi:hypothetical protein FHG87_002233 [Trinorchestia longiramus]|nr:hypothetical protein FHG87_002233 [Trinorchestia longiramus]
MLVQSYEGPRSPFHTYRLGEPGLIRGRERNIVWSAGTLLFLCIDLCMQTWETSAAAVAGPAVVAVVDVACAGTAVVAVVDAACAVVVAAVAGAAVVVDVACAAVAGAAVVAVVDVACAGTAVVAVVDVACAAVVVAVAGATVVAVGAAVAAAAG